jgi:hypothetical protein
MTAPKTMHPADFAERLDASFRAEPPHRDVASDVALGRRRLRRRRATVTLGALTAVAVIAGVGSAVPTLFPGSESRPAEVAADGEPSRAGIVSACMRAENVMARSPWNGSDQEAFALMGVPRLMTSAVSDNRVEATLLSEDGSRWGECQLGREPDNGVKSAMNIYPTDVSFPARRLGGVPAYEPHDEADPRLEGTATAGVPNGQVTCVIAEPEETPEYYRAASACPTFTLFWNDRRPAEVAAVEVVAPDGVSTWADVRGGYVSLAYTGVMTPKLAERVRQGEQPVARRVVFYDSSGEVLVDDRNPGKLPQEGTISIANFPSLAWWLSE